MKALLLMLLISISFAHGAITVSPGVSATSAHKTDEKALNGKEIVTFETAMGITVDTEWMFMNDSIGLSFGLLWRGGPAESQYSYTNPKNPLDTASATDLKTNTSTFGAFIGPRFRFLNMKYFKLFAGAGWMPGILFLTYNENKFELENGSVIGFKDKEQQQFQGTYFEVGMELFSSRGGALRVLGRQSQQRTDAFETLGKKRLNMTTAQLAIQYVHIF